MTPAEMADWLAERLRAFPNATRLVATKAGAYLDRGEKTDAKRFRSRRPAPARPPHGVGVCHPVHSS